jgi:hypothetical protein
MILENAKFEYRYLNENETFLQKIKQLRFR